ncbi:site-specific DNA-methyltransferase [Heyndrickxia ginsengihumi]|uniref:site-specific DNA-methyltransferase n=1 Tax=Heyndrickxia ginsengihumi TaxID=363870 RepID=UPI0004B6EAD7|nr:site-specific DNA-methyltransferase [Heyndrickxia ginsengihumi]
MSKERRQEMTEFLDRIRKEHTDDSSIIAINEIENYLTDKKYGLVWEEHKERVDEELETKIPVFTEVKEREIYDKPDERCNFLIEGDNLHSLYLLNKTHKGKVDVIYIDPPYNTGNKDFKYNDQFVIKDDGFKHSKWLSFMDKRLRVARKLLSKNGIIFISIDDHEYGPLKLLCDEIFGEKNMVSTMIWQRKTGASDANGIATITEYILVYAKSSNKELWKKIFTQNDESFDEKRYRKSDSYVKERGPYYPDNLDRGGLRYSDSLNFGIECPDGTITYPNGRTKFLNDGWTWKWGKDKVKWGRDNGFIEFERSKNKESGWAVKYKNYLYVDNEGNPIDRSAPHKNLILDILNGEGTTEINQVVGKKKFNNPKPLRLIKHLIQLINNKNAIVLDFFAGSGTTGQAVLELNQFDGGDRKFILCTNNENNICESVTYPRVENVIKGYEFEGKKEVLLFEKKLTQTDLRNMEKIFKKIEDLKKEHTDNYNGFKTTFKKGIYALYGVLEKDGKTKPIQANLKYYKTDFIERYSNGELYISEQLMNHITEMIQLEYHLKIDQQNFIILKDDEEKDRLFQSLESLKNYKKVFKPSYVFFTTKELKKIQEFEIEVVTIPDYYFADELRRVGEL